MTDSVPLESPIGIRRVVSHLQIEQGTEFVGFGATQRQNRLTRPWAHRGESSAAGTAQEAQEHGFGLIVGSVPGEGIGADRGAASIAGACLEVGTVGNFDAFASELHVEPVRNRLGN